MDEEATILMRDYAGGLVEIPLPHGGGLEFNIDDPSVHRLLQYFHSPEINPSQEEFVDESDAWLATGPRRRSSRRLQDTCEAGDAFTLLSNLYSDAEGCYTASEGNPDSYKVEGTNRLLFKAFVFSSSSTTVIATTSAASSSEVSLDEYALLIAYSGTDTVHT